MAPMYGTLHDKLFSASLTISLSYGGEIPFHVFGRKYTESTDSRPHAYNTLVYMYIEGEAWQGPLQEMYC